MKFKPSTRYKRIGPTGCLFTEGKIYTTDPTGRIPDDLGNRRSAGDTDLWQELPHNQVTDKEVPGG